MAPRRDFSTDDRYGMTAEVLRGRRGTLLDVGARDRVLRERLDLTAIRYASADLGSGHDYRLDLERPLPLESACFDFVTALDVLEHVEHIHAAFGELARITRRVLVISLPNMATWRRRWSFLWRGHLGTGKYDLAVEHQDDRHRWLTVYPEINGFIAVNAERAGLTWARVVEELEPSRLRAGLLWLASRGLFRHGEMTERCLYVLEKG